MRLNPLICRKIREVLRGAGDFGLNAKQIREKLLKKGVFLSSQLIGRYCSEDPRISSTSYRGQNPSMGVDER
jgi:hypothetical protein